MMLIAGSPRGEDSNYRMILPTVVYDESLDAEDEWLGLFDYSSMYMLRSVDLRLTPQDIIVYEGERPPGILVELPEEEYAVPLILVSSSMPVFTAGSVLTVVYDYMHLLPELSVVFNKDELEEVRLFTTEEGLFLSNGQIEQHITDTFPGEEHDDIYMGIVWAGDIDRDGKLDFLLNDVSDGYYIYKWDLYLSSEANPDQLVGIVASFLDVYY